MTSQLGDADRRRKIDAKEKACISLMTAKTIRLCRLIVCQPFSLQSRKRLASSLALPFNPPFPGFGWLPPWLVEQGTTIFQNQGQDFFSQPEPLSSQPWTCQSSVTHLPLIEELFADFKTSKEAGLAIGFSRKLRSRIKGCASRPRWPSPPRAPRSPPGPGGSGIPAPHG